MKNNRYQYFVEGECERKLITTLKEQKTWVVSGKIEVFNVKLERITELRLRQISDNTTVILIFDTDTIDTENLRY